MTTLTDELVACRGALYIYVVQSGTWWKLRWETPWSKGFYGGQYVTRDDAVDAAHRYASP